MKTGKTMFQSSFLLNYIPSLATFFPKRRYDNGLIPIGSGVLSLQSTFLHLLFQVFPALVFVFPSAIGAK